jgi:glycosyltransferase involved in cell wall biosynthesis
MSSVAADEVVGYIATSDVSLLPLQNVCLSYYYCMPNKLLESVFAGVPVAVANLLELRRFVEANQCGLVMDETRPDSIAQAIKRIVEDRERYLLSSTHYVMITDLYGWQSQATHLQSLYSEFRA